MCVSSPRQNQYQAGETVYPLRFLYVPCSSGTATVLFSDSHANIPQASCWGGVFGSNGQKCILNGPSFCQHSTVESRRDERIPAMSHPSERIFFDRTVFFSVKKLLLPIRILHAAIPFRSWIAPSLTFSSHTPPCHVRRRGRRS